MHHAQENEIGNISHPQIDKGPSAPTGSRLYPVDGRRHLNTYVLTEDNLEHLGLLDSIFNISLAVASALLSFAGAIVLSLSLADSSTAANVIWLWAAFLIVCLAMGVACVFFCAWSFKKRKGSIQKIKDETEHIPR